MAMTDPTMMPAEQEEMVEDTGAMGVCLEIHCLPDGTFTVVSEPLEGEEEMAEQGEPAESIGAALKMVLMKYKDWQSQGGSEDDQMASGFDSVRGSAAAE